MPGLPTWMLPVSDCDSKQCKSHWLMLLQETSPVFDDLAGLKQPYKLFGNSRCGA
jgi:hypothetical protein